ncbi:MAG: hypothetical protein AB7U82_17470 [Blastocatellales bacterium]
MNKPNYLYGIIGLLAGLIIGYIGTNYINQTNGPAVTANRTVPTSGALPPDHPPTGATGGSSGAMSASPGTMMSSSQSGGSGAVKWAAPARWEAKPASGMRAATYLIPTAKGDSEGAECAVFENLGGGVQANIDRWIGQFEKTDNAPIQKQETVNGLNVTTVDVSGTFKGGGPMMGQSSGPKVGYRLLGAIAEGPEGEVFFKLTGPAKTVAAAQAEFLTMLKSLKK